MINKKSLWFLTLFSLILVLSVYYITMPSELLLTDNKTEVKNKDKKTSVEVKEVDALAVMRTEDNEKVDKELKDLQSVMESEDKSTEEKNAAYEKIKNIKSNRTEEETLEKKVKEEYSLSSYIKIDGENINVTVKKKKHDKELANKIMRSIQANYKEQKYITIKFKS